MRSALLAVLLGVGSLAGCSRSADETASEQASEGAPSAAPQGQGPATWSREAAGDGLADGGLDAGPLAVSSVEPSALEELLAATPKEQPKSTGEDGRTAIGTETGEKEARSKKGAPAPSAAVDVTPAPPKKGLVSIGAMSIQGDMSSPSIERSARAQLYWPLVQRCRDKEGKILPPDAILILFRIDEDGYIIGSSISATPSKPAFEDAAQCMRRELSAATFRAPAGARGLPANVNMTAPSID